MIKSCEYVKVTYSFLLKSKRRKKVVDPKAKSTYGSKIRRRREWRESFLDVFEFWIGENSVWVVGRAVWVGWVKQQREKEKNQIASPYLVY